MNFRSSAFSFFYVVLLFIPFAPAARTQVPDAGEAKVSIYQWPSFAKQPPLEIVALKVAHEKILPGKPFPRSEAWLKYLTVTVRNISQKNIKYIRLRIRFPDDSKDNPILSDRFISGGQMFYFSPQIPRFGEDVTLAPTQTIDLITGNRLFWGLGAEIGKKGLPKKAADSPTISVDMVLFDDNTGWMIGSAAVRDKDDPGRWVRDKSQDPSSSRDKKVKPKN